MHYIQLEPPCPKMVNGLSFDPNPRWSFDEILSELNLLESKLDASDSPLNARPFTKSPLRGIPGAGRSERNEAKTFVMRVADDEFDISDDEDEVESKSVVPAGRFVCDDIYLSETDDSEDEARQPLQVALIDKTGVLEGALIELTHDHQLGVKEEIRSQLSALKNQLVTEKEKSTSALVKVEKDSDTRREKDRKLDMDYQRNIAEALDNHLTAIQRDHEHRSQIEERKIRDDAAIEEAKRKEKALLEEKLLQQKAKAEEEARREAARRAEERKAAEEAERAKQAADKLAKDRSERAATATKQIVPSTPDVASPVQSAGNLIVASENALKLEERRLQHYKELVERNQSIISGSKLDLRPKEREIVRRIKQISGSIESVRSKAMELLKIFSDPTIPQSVTVAMFAKKVISIYGNPNANSNNSAFACGFVIVYVSSQVPAITDCLLAEFHKACMYTVPKHIVYRKTAFGTKESYFKAIGYQEEDGKLESTDQYLERLGSYMKLYGALVQTQVQGVQNMHGLEEGWIWLSRFLNCLPANLYTAVALEAFLRMAGFALYRKYKLQFRKILNAVSQQFLKALRARVDPQLPSVITSLQQYIDSNSFLQEPQGRSLADSVLSHTILPEDDRY